MKYKVSSTVWIYPGEAAWHFLSIDKLTSLKIKDSQKGKLRRGFGAVKVEVTIGKSIWQTSIFPDKRSSTYLLPLKLSIRKAEGIMSGDQVNFKVEIM